MARADRTALALQQNETDGVPSELAAALHALPDLHSMAVSGKATFDELFWAHYARWPVRSKHLTYTRAERRALETLYPAVRQRFEAAHGRIVEEYWCTTVPAGAVRTLDGEGRRARAEFCAIVDWKQEDADLVAPMLELDEIEVGTKFLPEYDPALPQAQHLIYDAYTSALDALESRHNDRHIKKQAQELKLIERQVELARKFFRNAGQRYARRESLRGLIAALIVLLAIAAVSATLFWMVGIDASGTPARLLSWAVVGAIGACLSLFVGGGKDRYRPTWEATADDLQTSGASRPLVGAVLGAAIPMLVVSGLAALASELKDGSDVKTFAYLTLALAAGFSERTARDLIARQVSVLGAGKGSGAGEPDAA